MPRTSHVFLRWTLIAASMIGTAHAADIYRWVDESGRVHVSDVVPEKYRAKAKRMDSQRFELTPAQKAEAQARQARRVNSGAAAASASAASRERPGANQGNDAASAPAAASLSGPPKKPASPPPDCDALWRAYADSQACFAPFQNVNGTMKPGANEACTEVPDPSPQCGLPEPVRRLLP